MPGTLAAWHSIRDICLFVGGFAGVAFETVVRTGGERPTLLILFAAMMGLPAFLRSDEKHAPPKAPPPPEKGEGSP